MLVEQWSETVVQSQVVPDTAARIKSSLGTVNRSFRIQMLPKKVNSVASEARMVFDVTEVRARDALKVH